MGICLDGGTCPVGGMPSVVMMACSSFQRPLFIWLFCEDFFLLLLFLFAALVVGPTLVLLFFRVFCEFVFIFVISCFFCFFSFVRFVLFFSYCFRTKYFDI